MKVPEWGTILVTCKRAAWKMQILVQPEFNSVPAETKIFSHLLIKRKLINAFSSEVLFLLNKQTERTNETDKVSWRIILGGWKAAEVTGRLPNTQERWINFPCSLVSLPFSRCSCCCWEQHTNSPMSLAQNLWGHLVKVSGHVIHPLRPSYPIHCLPSYIFHDRGAIERLEFASESGTAQGPMPVAETAWRHLPTSLTQFLPWDLTERAVWINIDTKHSQEWEFTI